MSPRPPRRRNPLRRRLLWTVPLGLLVSLVLVGIGSLRTSLPLGLLAGALAGVVGALVPWLLTATGRYAEPALWSSTPRPESAPPTALDYRLVRIRRDLRDSLERDDREDATYPLLRELAAERLASRHGIDLDLEPERARALVTPGLWSFLSAPPTGTRRRSRAALRTAIEGIEQL